MTRTIVVAVLRHPDAPNLIEVSGADDARVVIVDMDLGDAFDGYPRDEDEAEAARELTDSWEAAVAGLPRSPAVDLVLSTVAEIREYADQAEDSDVGT